MVDVIIPTYKVSEDFVKIIEKLKKQSVKINKIIVVNTCADVCEKVSGSVSSDANAVSFESVCDSLSDYQDLVEIHNIKKQDFDHGKTRNLGVSFSKADIFVMMTQDALPVNDFFIEELVSPLADENVGASYGRQIAYEKSSYIEKVTREFNYPSVASVKSKSDLEKLGIKTYFCSNVSCAYRRDIFDKQGGFINRTIFNEDMIYAAGLINNGYKIAYAADAQVFHSHDYTGLQQFKRNVDIGVSQADNSEIFKVISSEKEGSRMVRLVIKRFKQEKKGYFIIPYMYINICKYMGYIIGKNYKKFPKSIIKACSMSPYYFC